MNPQLPPLPEPSKNSYKAIVEHDGLLFTGDEMTAYGQQCAEAERARCLKICRDVAQEELDRRQHYASSVASTCANFIEGK